MIVQDITYAIVGEATPTNGLKVDISKPEATISGLWNRKKDSKFLFSFDFKGGITDRNFSIWKGNNSFGTAFEFKPSIHFIPPWSWANFGVCDVARPAALIVDARNQIVKQNALALQDTIIAIATIRSYHLKNANLPNNPKMPIATAPINDTLKRLIIYFTKKIIKNDALHLDVTDSLPGILKHLGQVTITNGHIDPGTYREEVDQLYKKYEKLNKTIQDDTATKMINNASQVWTKKTYQWFTASPFLKTEKVNEYYTQFEGRDSSYFKSDYRLYYGVTGYYNLYVVWPKKVAVLLRGAATISYSNNLTNLTAYNYEKRTPFFSYGNAVTEKTVTGSAYNHADIKSDWARQFTIDAYLLPLKSLRPGIFVSTNINHSKLYTLPNVVARENDKTQWGLEGGLVFNINSREKDKDKSLLSILFYGRFEDLTDKRRTTKSTEIVETRDDFMKRNLSLGIRVGIPITLPQSTD